MKPYADCGPCILKWIYERLADPLTEAERFTVLRNVMSVLSTGFVPSVNLGALCNRSLEAVAEFFPASSSVYGEFKVKCNQAASRLLDRAGEFIQKGKAGSDRIARACGIAALGNVAPIGAPSTPFEFSHVEEIIKGKAPLPLMVGDVSDAISRARRVLYVADNAGEIGFDSLVISLLKESGLEVTLVVKEEPFFDDATMKDASFFGLDRTADAILSTKAIFVPGEAPEDLANAFARSDLVISKGTGNCEALKDEGRGKKTIYLLKAKCRPISEQMAVEVGKFIVKVEK
ncbi:MAG: ARMT1-like domain-containing protein [Thermodesulfobacteriota bacterium]